MRALGTKKNVFFGNEQPKYNARAHLKHSGFISDIAVVELGVLWERMIHPMTTREDQHILIHCESQFPPHQFKKKIKCIRKERFFVSMGFIIRINRRCAIVVS